MSNKPSKITGVRKSFLCTKVTQGHEMIGLPFFPQKTPYFVLAYSTSYFTTPQQSTALTQTSKKCKIILLTFFPKFWIEELTQSDKRTILGQVYYMKNSASSLRKKSHLGSDFFFAIVFPLKNSCLPFPGCSWWYEHKQICYE